MDLHIVMQRLPVLLKGSEMTIELTVLTIIFGSLLGVLLALLKISKNKVISNIATFYIWIFRGTPLLLQIFFIYYALPMTIPSLTLTPFTGATIALSLNCGAYMAEIIRGGIVSIDKGQFEACKALGFTYGQTMFKVVLPQTFRVIIPPVGNQFISMLKDTSLVSTIAMVELMRTAQEIYAATFKPTEIFATTAVLYLLMTTVFSTVFNSIEKKLSVY
ncbi:MAG: amino acid ABC transporter permease [Bacillota bacterium]|nr:amino acid ABC transporter permease [Bacillota bacterium]